MRKLVYLGGAALLLVASTAGCRRGHSQASLPESMETLHRVRTISPEADQTTDVIKASGTTAPLSSTRIMPIVPGVIRSLPVKEGEVVKKGQVVAVIDQRGFKLSLRQADAAIATARVALDATAREKDRFQKLLQGDATAQAQFDQVMDRFHGAQAAMNQALVARDMAQKALGDTVIVAPYSGVVVKKVSSVGDYATTMPPTVIVSMMDVSALELKISLPEPELQRVEEGAKVEASFGAVAQKAVTKVSRIVRSVDPLTRSFEVIAEVPNDGLVYRPGLFAEVRISTSRPRKRLLVPTSAVIDEGGGIFALYVVHGRVARRVEVKVSTADSSRTEILSGLTGSEQVVMDASGLLDGDWVEPQAMSGMSGSAEASR